jgi:hypothetical protein
MWRGEDGGAVPQRDRAQRMSLETEVAMARALPSSFPAVAAVLSLCVAGSAFAVSSVAASPGAQSASTAAACPPFPGAAAFVERIDNRYLPMIPGSVYIYRGKEDGEEQRNVVEVTHETKTILGVKTVVVRDTVMGPNGALIELTLDWFAQDTAGNVWYFGEDSKDYEHGQVVSTEGSWEAGVAGAQAGIIMKAQPLVGDAYSQECAPGVAEDAAEVRGLKAKAKTPYGNFSQTLRTRETNPLEPGVAEDKFYAPCVGMVRVEVVQGGSGSTSLVEVKNGPSRSELGCPGKDKQRHKPKHKKKH